MNGEFISSVSNIVFSFSDVFDKIQEVDKIWLFILEFGNKNVIFNNQKQKCQTFVILNPKHFIKVGNRKINILLMINYFNHIIPQRNDHFFLFTSLGEPQNLFTIIQTQ